MTTPEGSKKPDESKKPEPASADTDVKSPDPSQPGQATNSSEKSVDSKTAPAAEAKKRKPRNWRRRILRTLVAVCILIIGFRILLSLILPSVLNRVAGYYGMSCDYQRLELNMLNGDAGIWGMEFRPVEGGSPIVQTDYCHGNISVMDLLRGKLVAYRVEADGVEMNIDRTADGRIPLLDRFVKSTASAAASSSTPVATSAQPRTIDLTSPLQLDAFRLTHLQVHFHDLSVSPVLDTVLQMDVRLSDLGSPSQPAKFEMSIESDPLLESLQVDGEGRSAGKTLDAIFHARVRGIHPKAIAPYLQPLGIDPVADRITMQADVHLHTDAAPNNAEGFTGSAVFDNMFASADGREALALDHFTLAADVIDPKSIRLGKLELSGVRATGERAADGNIAICGVEWNPKGNSPASTQPASAAVNSASGTMKSAPGAKNAASGASISASASPSGAANSASASPPMPTILISLLSEYWSLAEIDVKNIHATFHDAGITPATDITFVGDSLSISNIVHDPQNLNTTVKLSAAARLPGIVRDVKLSGSAQPFAATKTFQIALAASGIKPDALRPYLDAIGVESQFKNGSFTCSADGSFSILAGGNIHGDAKIGKVDLSDGDDLLTLTSATFAGIALDPTAKKLRVESIEVSGPGVRGDRTASGTLEMFGLRTKRKAQANPDVNVSASLASSDTGGTSDISPAASTATTTPTQAAASAKRSDWTNFSLPPIPALPKIEIGHFVWKGISAEFNDFAVAPPTKFSMSDVGVDVTNFSTDPATTKPGHIIAWLSAAGLADKLQLEGDISPNPHGASLDFKVEGRHITASAIAPYLELLKVEPTLQDGSLNLHAKAFFEQDEGKLGASLAVDHFVYADGTTELLATDGLEVQNLSLSSGQISVDAITLDHPRAWAMRDADGSIVAGGIRLHLFGAGLAAGSNSIFANAGVSNPMGANPSVATPIAATPVVADGGGFGATIANPTTAPAATNPDIAAIPATTNPTVAIAATSPATLPAAAPHLVAILQKFQMTGGDIHWIDRAVQPTVDVNASATIDLENLVLGKTADPARLNLTAKADGAADAISVTGNILTAPDEQSAKLAISATGLRIGPLAAYVPKIATVSLADGRFGTWIFADVTPNRDGGYKASLRVEDLNYADGADGSLAKVDSVKITAPRIDPAAKIYAFDEITVAGVDTSAQKTPQGGLALLGLILGAPANPPTTEPASTTQMVLVTQTPAPTTQAAVSPGDQPATPTSAAGSVASTADLLAAAHAVLPLITVEKIDIGVKHLSLADGSRPAAAPVDISDLHLTNLNRIDLLGKDAAAKPATHLRVTCRVDPLVNTVTIDTMLAPFAQLPNIQVDFTAAGVRGDGLTKLVPELQPYVDGTPLTDGQLKAHLEAQMKIDRRSPIDFDLSHGFDLDFLLKDVQYTGAAGGPILAGVDSVQSEGIRVEPAHSFVDVKSLEITKPAGTFVQDAAGLHALGWVIKLPPAVTQFVSALPKPGDASQDGEILPSAPAQTPIAAAQTPNPSARIASATGQPIFAMASPEASAPRTAPAASPAANPAATDGPAVTGTVIAKPTYEVRIDKILISGLDARIEDQVCAPPLIVPLNRLDVEVRGFSTMALYEDRPPIKFSAIVGAGKVRLPKPAGSGNGSAQDEDRDMFAQITANGNISLYPTLNGWAKSSVSGLELASLKGLAKQQGITLTAGTYDDAIDLRFNPDGSIDTSSKLILTDLSVSEPPKGPIFQFLKLPAPLDVCIAAVQDADGSITLPLGIPIRKGHVSTGDIVGAATGAVANVAIVAVASAPLKAANMLGGIVGIGAGKKPKEQPVVLQFAAGSGSVDFSQLNGLAPILKRMKDDKSLTLTIRHTLGGGDIVVARTRANPSPADCLNLEYQFRQRKSELLQLRADVAGQARAQLVSLGEADAGPTLARLKAIDQEIAHTEDSLDEVGDLLRPGADRQSDRRTRAAALAIAQDRLQSVLAILQAAGVPDFKNRVHAVEAQYNPTEDANGGQIVITEVETKG
jgi:hypothetical protein